MANPRSVQRIPTAKEGKDFLYRALGIMRAEVIKDNDEWNLGRVQVRVPSIHGVKGTTEFVEDEDLPWAMPCVPGGSGEDMGSFLTPKPGSFVWIFFEDDDTNKPVYLGGVPSKGSDSVRTMGNLNDADSPVQSWETTPNTPEVAGDMFDEKSSHVPERGILYKSQKGHTIMMDDTDGAESMMLIDRVGQVFGFTSPVSTADNTGGYRRGTARADKGTQLNNAAGTPTIYMQSGPTSDVHFHQRQEWTQDSFHSEYINEDEPDHSTQNDTTAKSFYQRTYKTEIEMLEDSYRAQYKEIKQFMNDEQYTVDYKGASGVKITDHDLKVNFRDTGSIVMNNSKVAIDAFDVCHIEMTKSGIQILFEDHGFKIDASGVVQFFGDSKITVEDTKISLDTSGTIEENGSSLSLSGGSASMETDGGKLKLSGDEIHLN